MQHVASQWAAVCDGNVTCHSRLKAPAGQYSPWQGVHSPELGGPSLSVEPAAALLPANTKHWIAGAV